MESRRQDLEKQGLRVASISYDTPAILKHFAERKKIGYPLLSDPESAAIRAFGVLNESVPKGTPFHGIPHPVTFVVDGEGKILRKYAEVDYRERQSLSGVLVRDFGVTSDAARSEAKAKHVQIAASASAATVVSGERISLVLDVDIPKGYHLYAPGVEGYIPVVWNMAEATTAKAKPVSYPASRILFIQAIDEKVPVYEGRLRLVRDVTIADDKSLKAALGEGTSLTLNGTFKYQACSETLCYPPETVPVRWTLQIQPHDRERVPAELRKPSGLN